MKRFPGLKPLAILCISIFTGGCAVDRPPSGGPPDTTPLAVTASAPEPGSINVSRQVIRIAFNRYVTAPELRKALIISPSVRNYEVTMHGREAEIRFHEPLQPGKTYTITLRKSLKSFYGNELAASWSLPFSTGPVIDRGTLDGKVWTQRLAPAPNITVVAYAEAPAGVAAPDSLPSTPDYATQTDTAGDFRFESLAPGSYRVAAIDDRNGNFRYDRNNESYAVTGVRTVSVGQEGLPFRLAQDYTSPVAIRSAKPIDTREIEVTFSRPVASRTLDPATIVIRDLSTGAPLPVLGCYGVNRAEEETTFRLLTGVMNPKSLYTIAYATDAAAANPSLLTFLGGMRSVTWPKLTVGMLPADKSVNALPELVRPDAGPCVELQCNLPVEEASIRKSVTLEAVRSTGEQELPVTVSKYDSRTFTVRPVGGFERGIDYKVSVRPTLISTLTGARGRDTLLVSRFSTAGIEQYGEITGSGSSAAASAVVEAHRAGTTAVYRTIVRPSSGGRFTYAFRELPPGSYTVFAYVPASAVPAGAEPAWNPGSLEPFRPADPFIAVAANVRQGWTTEVPEIRIPSSISKQTQATQARPAKQKPGKR